MSLEICFSQVEEEHISLGICFFLGRGTHITSDTCFQGRGTHITSDICFQGRETHITRDMSFSGRGTHYYLYVFSSGKDSTILHLLGWDVWNNSWK